jgi:uncharacterized protein YcbK (DUF882 family)
MALKLKPVKDPSKIYPARIYENLAMGFDTSVNWESQTTLALENSDKSLRNLSPFIIRPLIPEFYQEFFDKQNKLKNSLNSTNGTITEETADGFSDVTDAFTKFQEMLKAQTLYAMQYATFNFQDVTATPLDPYPIEGVPQPTGFNEIADYQLTKNFMLSQFSSRGNLPPENYNPIDPKGVTRSFPVQANLKIAATQVEIIKATIETVKKKSVKIKIISGWRSIEHNMSTFSPGSTLDPFGNHAQGKAIDFYVKGMSIPELGAIIDVLRSNGGILKGGLGLYETFVHYDIRGQNDNWVGDSKEDLEHEGRLNSYVKALPKELTNGELVRIAQEVGKGLDFPTYRSTGSSEDRVSYDTASKSVDAFNNSRQARFNNASQATNNFLGAFKSIVGIEDAIVEGGLDYASLSSQQIFLADRMVALDILYQLRTIQEIPPLVLLINPQSLAINYTKVSQFTERGRYGYIYQTWGDELPKMSVSGKIGAFVTAFTDGEIGLNGVQFASKRNSAAFQNLMNLLLFYKNNGYIYNQTEARTPSTLHSVGLLAIEYDGWVYEGNMESFTYSYSEEVQNGGMEFSFEFSIEKMIPPSANFNIRPPQGFPFSGTTVDPIPGSEQGFFSAAAQGALDALIGIGQNVLDENSIRETINTGEQLLNALNADPGLPPPQSETLLAPNRRGFITT